MSHSQQSTLSGGGSGGNSSNNNSNFHSSSSSNSNFQSTTTTAMSSTTGIVNYGGGVEVGSLTSSTNSSSIAYDSTMNNFNSTYDSGGPIGSGSGGFSYADSSSSAIMSGASGGSYSSSNHKSSAQTSFFSNSSQSKYEDLKQMLESSKEPLKLEAMKRIITMVAKGRSPESGRELFPHVVKNVVTKNTELKKLVYLYLTRYAEQEQDLALLSIATFQHALKDPNPLIRGSAIRVLSSIRVPMISPIMLIAIKDCANDMSPYVRKTAAHAIPKLFHLDPEIRSEIIEIIAKLLSDKVSLVLGSAVAAFEEICPERFDLIHENFRKLCSLLVDVDEWGQIIVINMLLRYARTQFLNPANRQRPTNGTSTTLDPDHLLLIRSVKPLLQSRNSGVVLAVIQLYLCIAPESELTSQIVRPLIRLLHSHREIQLVILKNIVTLTGIEFNSQCYSNIQSSNVGLIVSNKDLFSGKLNDSNEDRDSGSIGDHHHQQQKQQKKRNSNRTIQNGRPLMSKNEDEESENEMEDGDEEDQDEEDDEEEEEEVSSSDDEDAETATAELSNIRATNHKTIRSLFEQYLKSFFVKAKDGTQSKILKLEILTNLSNSGNISLILREFQAYILNYQDDLSFMSATIESIGQCASRIKEIAPICLNGLVSLLSNRNETIVAQSIVVIRTQIINKDHSIISMIVKQIVKLMEKISIPQARATIVWIVAEFCSRNDYARKVAPDVLRMIARSFTNESDLVKLQALNLASKLYLTTVMADPDHSESPLSATQIDRLKQLINYVFNLAKYDLNYDVRDRGRFLRQLLNNLEMAKKILLVPKLVPNVSQRSVATRGSAGLIAANGYLSSSVDSAAFRIGTLSHFMGKKANDYEELPDWPDVQPDPSVRRSNVPEVTPKVGGARGGGGGGEGGGPIHGRQSPNIFGKPINLTAKNNGFLSEEETEEDDDEEEVDDDEEEDEEEDDEEEEIDNEEYEEVEETEEEEESEEEEEEEEESEEDIPPPPPSSKKNLKSKSIVSNRTSTNGSKGSKSKTRNPQPIDLLLDFDDLSSSDTLNPNSSSSTLTTTNTTSTLPLPLLSSPLSPANSSGSTTPVSNEPYRILSNAEHLSFKEFPLLTIHDLVTVSYRFLRINETVRTLVELLVKNTQPNDSNTNGNPKVTIQAPKSGSVVFKNIESEDSLVTVSLSPNESRQLTLAIDFNESPSLGIELIFNRSHTVKLIAPLGDILNPVRFGTVESFMTEKAKLSGMNEVCVDTKLSARESFDSIRSKLDSIVLSLANVCTNRHLPSSLSSDPNNKNRRLFYSAATLKVKSLILISIELISEDNDNSDEKNDEKFQLIRTTVNCEKMVFGSMLSKLIKDECGKQLCSPL